MLATHPNPKDLVGYLHGRLPWDEMDAVEVHAQSCADCRTRMEQLEPSRDAFLGALAGLRTRQPEPGLAELVERARKLVPGTVDFVRSAKRIAGCDLLDEVGMHGGLGVVYTAVHPVLKDLRAIKRPRSADEVERAQLFARFRKEVQAVGSLRHENVVRALDAGADEDGPFLVMEFLDGESLRELQSRNNLLPPAEVCEMVRQTALGLQAAHEKGLVHRDIKPGNLMLVRGNSGTARVVIIDWGLARSINDPIPTERSQETSSGVVLGTPEYMAPEQADNPRSVDTRADLYSLGVTLYCLLTNQLPFPKRTKMEQLYAHQHEPIPDPEKIRSDIPQGLSAVLAKMTAKSPQQRYQTPAEAAVALAPFCVQPQLRSVLDGTPLPSRTAATTGNPLTPTTSFHEGDRRTSQSAILETNDTTPAEQVPKFRLTWWIPLAGAALLLVLSLPGCLGLTWWLYVGGVNRNEARPQGDTAQTFGETHIKQEPKETPQEATGIPMRDRHPGHVSSIVFLPDGKHAVSESGGGAICVWDIENRHLEKKIPHASEKPSADHSGVVAISDDKKYIFAAGIVHPDFGMQHFSLYDQKTFERVGKDYLTSVDRAVTFSPDGTRLMVAELPPAELLERFGLAKRHLTLFDLKTDKRMEIKTVSPVRCSAYSPDGKYLAAGSDDKVIRLWSFANRRWEREFVGHTGAPDRVTFSEDGKRIYSASGVDRTLRVWSNDSAEENVGKELRELKLDVDAKKYPGITFDKYNRALIGSDDGRLVLLSMESGKELQRFTHKESAITAVAVSPDGRQALAATADFQLWLYPLPSPERMD